VALAAVTSGGSRYRPFVLFEPVFEALNARDVRFLVAGGVAVVLHGHLIAMKSRTGREKDIADVEALRAIGDLEADDDG
jgi:hypothetical protein